METNPPGPPRYRELDHAELDDEQRRVFEDIGRHRSGSVPLPFHIYLESPQLATAASTLGAFCRYHTGLPPRLSETAILTTAAHWGAAYEFASHTNEARKAGVPDSEIEALAAGRRPDFTDPDAALVHDFAVAFYRTRDVPDELFAQACARFGRRTVVELTGLMGYYSMLAICLITFRVSAPK